MNKKFANRLNNISPKILKLLTDIDQLKGQWIAGAKLNPQLLGRLKRSVLITSTGASTRIEGSKLTDEEIEKLMRGISIQKFTNRDEQEVRGYFELLTNVFESWQKLKLTESLVKHLHQELLKYVNKDELHRGQYKTQENKVHMVNQAGESIGILFDTTPAYLTPKEMQELIEWTNDALTNETYHPLLIIANFIVEFLKIHPFQDGNGRLSRILTNLLMLQSNYAFVPYISQEKLIEDNKPDYYLALRNSQKTFNTTEESITPWLEFFFTVILKQSHLAIELTNNENIEKTLSPSQLEVWQYMSETNEVTPKELSEKLNIPRPTINQIIDRLLQLKQVERLGQGRATRYKKTS